MSFTIGVTDEMFENAVADPNATILSQTDATDLIQEIMNFEGEMIRLCGRSLATDEEIYRMQLLYNRFGNDWDRYDPTPRETIWIQMFKVYEKYGIPYNPTDPTPPKLLWLADDDPRLQQVEN